MSDITGILTPSGSLLRRLPKAEQHADAREMVYVLGGSGVGKSTWINAHLAKSHLIVDPDIMVKDCPLEDPRPEEADSISFLWAKRRSDELLEKALLDGSHASFAFPGTGKGTCNGGSLSKKAAFILRAKEAGFRTRCVYLTCPREAAIARNAKRPRRLPDALVDASLETAKTAYEYIRHLVHVAEELDVSSHRARLQGRSMSEGTIRENAIVATARANAGDVPARVVGESRFQHRRASDGGALRRSTTTALELQQTPSTSGALDASKSNGSARGSATIAFLSALTPERLRRNSIDQAESVFENNALPPHSHTPQPLRRRRMATL